MKRFSILLIMSAVMPSFMQAQTMTLADCMSEGLENSYKIKLVRASEEKSANNDSWSNAGALPTLSLTGTYSTTDLETHSLGAQARADWTVFDGLGIQATRGRLEELHRQGSIQTRITIEDYVASLSQEYYDLLRQTIKLRNLEHGLDISRERLRVASERYDMGGNSRLEVQQARVYFNSDSASCLKQQEALLSARIVLNRLMSNQDFMRGINAAESEISINENLDYDSLLADMLEVNASILKAESSLNLAEKDRRLVQSRNYPYLKLNASYGVTDRIEPDRTVTDWTPSLGATVGLNLITGKQRTQERNARLDVLSAEIECSQLELELRSKLGELWQSYQSNLKLTELQRFNLETARETMEMAQERYMLGDLSGLEMREAQNSYLSAEESLLQALYNTKISEISLLQISGRLLDYAESGSL